MKNQVSLILLVLFLIFIRKTCSGNSLIISEPIGKYNDSVPKRTPVGTIKVNLPQALLFNEIPLSLEVFLTKNKSVQVEIGYIFPFNKEYYRSLKPDNPIQWFLTLKDAADEFCDVYISNHVSPYNSKGFSVKLNYRKYGRIFYISPQLTYKYSFYKEDSWEDSHRGSPSVTITESKYSNVIGFGCTAGRQIYTASNVIDAYVGIGLRYRFMSVTLLKKEYSYGPSVQYPNTKTYPCSFYPYINVGICIGIKLE